MDDIIKIKRKVVSFNLFENKTINCAITNPNVTLLNYQDLFEYVCNGTTFNGTYFIFTFIDIYKITVQMREVKSIVDYIFKYHNYMDK